MRTTRLNTLKLAAIAVAAAPLLLAGLSGCASTTRSATVTPPTERLREANQLAERAERALQDGETDRAIDLYRESVSVAGTASNWNNLGLLLMDQEDYAGAVNAFRRAGELEPSDPRPLANAGTAYFRAGWATDALRYFDLSLDIDQDFLPALRGSAAAGRPTPASRTPPTRPARTLIPVWTRSGPSRGGCCVTSAR